MATVTQFHSHVGRFEPAEPRDAFQWVVVNASLREPNKFGRHPSEQSPVRIGYPRVPRGSVTQIEKAERRILRRAIFTGLVRSIEEQTAFGWLIINSQSHRFPPASPRSSRYWANWVSNCIGKTSSCRSTRSSASNIPPSTNHRSSRLLDYWVLLGKSRLTSLMARRYAASFHYDLADGADDEFLRDGAMVGIWNDDLASAR